MNSFYIAINIVTVAEATIAKKVMPNEIKVQMLLKFIIIPPFSRSNYNIVLKKKRGNPHGI